MEPQGRAALLIIEDELALAEIVRTRLEESGYSVRIAGNMRDGLAALGETAPDLVILDLLLPDGSGYEVLSRIRHDGELESLPVLVLTGLGERSQIEDGFAEGANAYIPKPYDPDKLVAAVERLLEESARVSAGTNLDPNTH